MRHCNVSHNWCKAGLTPVLYHFTFHDNVSSILTDEALIANKGWSICRNPDTFVCLAERMTQGLVEFCGQVVLEFDGSRLYSRNPHLAPRDYGLSEEDVSRYKDSPFFEHEWRAPGVVDFELTDINHVLLIKSRDCKAASFRHVAQTLNEANLPYTYLHKSYLSDDIRSDTIRYFVRLECWTRFRRSLAL